MKKENLQNLYGKPSDGFHHSVMNALYHLDDKKKASHASGKRVMRIALVCALVAAVGTGTAAAATGLFGLFSKPVGTYGVNITAESNQSSQSEETEIYQTANDIRISTSYVPEGFVAHEYNGQTYGYFDDNIYSDNWYFMIFAYDSETYNKTETKVIENEETEFNGHSAVISKRKLSESNDRIEYVVTEKFDDEKIVLRCVFSGEAQNKKYFEPDRSEILRIMEGISIARTEASANNNYDSYSDTSPIADIYPHDLINTDKSKTGTVGTPVTVKVADYDSEEASLDIKVVSISDRTTAEGFAKEDFFSAGPTMNLYDYFFDKDGNLIQEITVEKQVEPGDGIDTLGKTVSKTFHRHLYNVKVEITADKDIEELFHVFRFEAFGLSNEGEIYGSSLNGTVEIIGYSGSNGEQLNLEKGKTLVMNCMVYADEETGNDPCFGIITANGNTDEAEMTYYRIKE